MHLVQVDVQCFWSWLLNTLSMAIALYTIQTEKQTAIAVFDCLYGVQPVHVLPKTSNLQLKLSPAFCTVTRGEPTP
jgi:hypothetical protein